MEEDDFEFIWAVVNGVNHGTPAQPWRNKTFIKASEINEFMTDSFNDGYTRW